jgi:putative nucleotidyltransferase with HDIG domain
MATRQDRAHASHRNGSPQAASRSLRDVRTFIRSRVARRMVVLFVSCALVPIVVLTVAAFGQISRQLRQASQARLHQASKSAAMETLGELRRLDAALLLVDALLVTGRDQPVLPDERAVERLEGLSSLMLVYDSGDVIVLAGAPRPVLPAGPDEIARMRLGRPVLTVDPTAVPVRLYLRRQSSSDRGGLLQAEIDPRSLWTEDMIAPADVLHVLGPNGRVLFTSWMGAGSRVDELAARAVARPGPMTWDDGGGRHLAHAWALPLAHDFLSPPWTIVISQAEADALAPVVSARTTFVLVTALTVWIVTLLSLRQVRRSLTPLTRLKAATVRIGQGDFDTDLQVRSGDEFEDLAASLNRMSRELRRHFDTQAAVAGLERAVLTSLDEETIVDHSLHRLPGLLGCDRAALVLAGAEPEAAPRLFATRAGLAAAAPVVRRSLDACDVAALSALGDAQPLDQASALHPALRAALGKSWQTGLALPLTGGDRTIGALVLADRTPTPRSAEDIAQARHVANQIAVALSNARLVKALDRLNVGTLNALARTVDAKSPWTAGHSQRVTALAVEIGRELGLADHQLDVLTRGGLLHDIGKIAVPGHILNKPAPLSAEEFALVREHPLVGARILEPIDEYRRLIPVVRHHHEWFDGRGYPDGLGGDAISLEARVLAVADVFDAVRSDRPYRAGMTLAESVAVVCEGSGTQFDPAIVRAFLDVLGRRREREGGAAA